MNSMNKSAVLFFCLIILGCSGFLVAQARAADEPPTELYVRTTPEGAKVFLNGNEVGVTPGLFKVDPGAAKIVVKLEGHDPIEKEVKVKASRVTRIEVDFNKQPANMDGPLERIRAISSKDTPIAGTAKWEGEELVVRSDAAATLHLFEIPISNRDQCIIIYRFRIKTEELKSGVYSEMYCRFPGKGEFFSRGLDQKLQGSNDWTSLQIPFFLKKGEFPDLLKLNMVFEGPGTIRLKDIEVLIAPLTEQTLPNHPKEDSQSAINTKETVNILKNPGIEAGKETPDDWEEGTWPEGLTAEGVTYSWDKKVAFEGKASLCIEKTAQNYMLPVAQWSQTVDRDEKQSTLILSAQVKADKVTKAILDVQFLDEDDNMISHKWASFIGIQKKGQKPANHDWKKYSGKVNIPPKTKKICVALQDYGPGKVWFDDVRAEYAK
ncbi:MAG: PEGA domain-containing protein [Thermoguttaceae bacterium]|jgi:hypothetical protein